MINQSLPVEERFTSDFTDHEPAAGTHTGNFLGHPATGKRFTVRNVQVVGFRDEKASDRWGSTDELGIVQQLGLA